MAQPSLNLILGIPFFENWPLYKKNLEKGNTKAAITKNFADIQQESGAGESGGSLGDLGFVSLYLVSRSLLWFGLVEFGLVLFILFGLVNFFWVWSNHRQTNKLNNYRFSFNLICEFVC